MKRHHAHDAHRRHMLANLQNKPQVEFRNPWGALAFCLAFLTSVALIGAAAFHYLSK